MHRWGDSLAAAEAPSVFEQIYRVVRCIPPGRVATYGQIARMAGMPRGARTVGWALHSLPEGTDVPWHRVVNARGTLHGPPGSPSAFRQRLLLEEEGIVFAEQERIDLERYGWCGLDGPNGLGYDRTPHIEAKESPCRSRHHEE